MSVVVTSTLEPKPPPPRGRNFFLPLVNPNPLGCDTRIFADYRYCPFPCEPAGASVRCRLAAARGRNLCDVEHRQSGRAGRLRRPKLSRWILGTLWPTCPGTPVRSQCQPLSAAYLSPA